MTLLRPHLLWLLLPAAALYAVLLWRRGAELRSWRAHIAPHLLPHMVVGAQGRGGLRPVHLLGVVLLLGIVAAAGPAWHREPSPFTADTATLVVAVDLSPSMTAKDVPPSRYQRAIHKVRDLLAHRPEARTGLVVYAGTAHLVLPPTRDVELLTTFLDALSPELMPESGKNAAAALRVAEEVLGREAAPGTILVLTDGPVPQAAGNAQVCVLAMGRQVKAPGADVVPVTVDDSDVQRLARRVETHFVAAQADDGDARWRDEGGLLAWPLLLLALFWFRRGWVVTWD